MKGFKEITSLKDHYELGDNLAKGAFGAVFHAKHAQTGTETAIKIVKKEKIQEREIHVELMQNELLVLETVTHPNIMRVFELMEDSENFYIVTEFISGGNLLDKLKEVGTFTE